MLTTVLSAGTAALIGASVVTPHASMMAEEAAALPSGSSTVTYTSSKSFSVTRGWRHDFGCSRVTLNGKIAYERSTYVSAGGHVVTKIGKPRVVEPQVRVWSYRYCYSEPFKLTQLDVTNSYSSSTCSLNPSISASYPWGIAASVTPACGSTKVGRSSAQYQADGTYYKMSNSGTKVTFKNTDTSFCLQPQVSLRVYRGTKSDSVTMNMQKPCVIHKVT